MMRSMLPQDTKAILLQSKKRDAQADETDFEAPGAGEYARDEDGGFS